MPKIKVSLINVPDKLSPLKLRGFLRDQAQDIQARTEHQDIMVMRVFVPSRIVAALGVQKLDRIFQNIVDRYANIQRVELLEGRRSLTAGEMLEEGEATEEELREVTGSFEDDPNPSGPH
jgi:hypothetical protein